jgi:hypothetical protein
VVNVSHVQTKSWEKCSTYKIKNANTMTKTNKTATKLIQRRDRNWHVVNVPHVAKILKHYRDSNITNEKGNHTDTE